MGFVRIVRTLKKCENTFVIVGPKCHYNDISIQMNQKWRVILKFCSFFIDESSLRWLYSSSTDIMKYNKMKYYYFMPDSLIITHLVCVSGLISKAPS